MSTKFPNPIFSCACFILFVFGIFMIFYSTISSSSNQSKTPISTSTPVRQTNVYYVRTVMGEYETLEGYGRCIPLSKGTVLVVECHLPNKSVLFDFPNYSARIVEFSTEPLQ